VRAFAWLGMPATTVIGSTGCLGRVAEWQTRWLQVPVSFGTWGFKSPFAHNTIVMNRVRLDASRPQLLAEVYLTCDLAATVMKNAHRHDGACGNRRFRDGNMRRLLLRPVRGLDAVNLEEAHEPDCAGEAGDQSAGVADRAPHPT
jgi:hypothetical protein